jgi:hypothetical protein
MAETLPPMTLNQLDAALANPNFSSYAYIGRKSDVGWKLAVGAQGYIPAVRVYLVGDAVKQAFRQAYGVGPQKAGIAFDFQKNAKIQLTKKQCEDALTVLNSIRDARA